MTNNGVLSVLHPVQPWTPPQQPAAAQAPETALYRIDLHGQTELNIDWLLSFSIAAQI